MKTRLYALITFIVTSLLMGCEEPASFGSASANIGFDGSDYTLSHPVGSLGVWPHKPGIRTVRIDIFQDPAGRKHVEQIKQMGVPTFMGNDLQKPHLVLNLHVKEEHAVLNKDAVEFVGITIQGVADSFLNANVTGPSLTAPMIDELSGTLQPNETITGKIKGSVDHGGKTCTYDIQFSAQIIADIPARK